MAKATKFLTVLTAVWKNSASKNDKSADTVQPSQGFHTDPIHTPI